MIPTIEAIKSSDIRLKYLKYSHLTQFENFLRLYKPIDHHSIVLRSLSPKRPYMFEKIYVSPQKEWELRMLFDKLGC